MFPEYISTVLWPFAVKCYEDRLNNLVHHADGQTLYKHLQALMQHQSTRPTFTLLVAHVTFWIIGCTQSGTGKIPKWEPQAQMGIYVG
jgi:hypothetical protein